MTKFLRVSLTGALTLILCTACGPAAFTSTGASDKASSGQSENVSATNPSQPGSSSINPADLRNLCLFYQASMFASTVAAGGSVTNLNGNAILRVSHAKAVGGIRGNTFVFGASPGALIDTINDVGGNVVLCGVSVTALSKVIGNVFVIDGNIGSADGVDGNLVVAGGSIGSVNNVRGTVITVP